MRTLADLLGGPVTEYVDAKPAPRCDYCHDTHYVDNGRGIVWCPRCSADQARVAEERATGLVGELRAYSLDTFVAANTGSYHARAIAGRWTRRQAVAHPWHGRLVRRRRHGQDTLRPASALGATWRFTTPRRWLTTSATFNPKQTAAGVQPPLRADVTGRVGAERQTGSIRRLEQRSSADRPPVQALTRLHAMGDEQAAGDRGRQQPSSGRSGYLEAA